MILPGSIKNSLWGKIKSDNLSEGGEEELDRFTRGLTAGIAGGILMNVWDFFSYYVLNFADSLYLHWAAVLLVGELPKNTVEFVYALVAQILWAGFLGIIFSFLISAVTSRGYLLKGAYWGFITGFLIYGLSILFRLPYFTKISTGTSITQFIGGIIWGLTAAYTLKLLDKNSFHTNKKTP